MEAAQLVIHALTGIPASFWGVIVGAVSTFLSVLATNRASLRRQREQFRHEADLKRREQELDLCKDIYMSVADTAQAGILLLVNLANVERTVQELTGSYNEKSSVIAKMQIVALYPTIAAMIDVVSSLSVAMLDVTVDRIPLDAMRSELLFLDNQVAVFGKERDRWIEQLRQYNLQGTVDERLLATIQGNFQFEHKRIDEMLARSKVLHEQLVSQQFKLLDKCTKESARLTALFTKAVIAVRRELGLPLDAAAYERMMSESLTKQKAAVKDFLARSAALGAKLRQAAQPADEG